MHVDGHFMAAARATQQTVWPSSFDTRTDAAAAKTHVVLLLVAKRLLKGG